MELITRGCEGDDASSLTVACELGHASGAALHSPPSMRGRQPDCASRGKNPVTL
jgi:hypothetical protein